MKKTAVALTSTLLLGVVAPIAGAILVWAVILGGRPVDSSAVSVGGGGAGIPLPMVAVYQAAATACPGLPWTTLAAIGTVESANGQSTLPGVHSGHNSAGAEGPMQFEPSTFAQYDLPVPAGGAVPPTPYDPVDATYAAARMLCANGAADGRDVDRAIYAYNHSAAYVDDVLQTARHLQVSAGSSGPASMASGAALVAVQFALAQVGTPYRWGGETPGVAFDCSGLVQAAWAAAGVRLPRVAQDQFAAGPLLPPGTPLEPGDLVFFGPAGGGVTHVGMVTDPSGEMVDAPHTGAFVRVESFPVTVGTAWGGDVFQGATRPGGY